MSLIISGATILDGTSDRPIEGKSIRIEGARIAAIGTRDELGSRPDDQVVDARGKFIIPGLMNANVHLFGAITMERLSRHWGHYEDVVAEAAQVCLKNGLTTVFDTWGPRRFLMNVRDRINSNQIPGSRVFCAGNIIGFDGPFSPDFSPKALEVASGSFAKTINAIFVENVGRHLMWLTPERVAKEVQDYIRKGVDFIKYGSNEHGANSGAFLQFSPRVQKAMVDVVHAAGITAQAHCMSVEGLHMAVEAGCDLITHCNITGPTPIPEETLELMARLGTGAVVFPWTEKSLATQREKAADWVWTMWHASDINARALIRSGAPLMLATDGMLFAPETLLSDPQVKETWGTIPEEENLIPLATGHFYWFKAMEEKGCKPMEMLKAATNNIAVAYGKDKDLGTVQAGKIADLVILDKNPLESAANYRSIHAVYKDGAAVNRSALPLNPILTKPNESAEEEACYVPFLHTGARFPMCPMCMIM